MDRFHGGVEAHGPSPEQRASFCASTAICDLIDFAVSPIATGRQNRSAVHCKQHRRSVEEEDAPHVEGVVEEVAVAQREGSGPVEVREDAEWDGLGPATHQDRAYKAEY